jgi:hypothetical protein
MGPPVPVSEFNRGDLQRSLPPVDSPEPGISAEARRPHCDCELERGWALRLCWLCASVSNGARPPLLRDSSQMVGQDGSCDGEDPSLLTIALECHPQSLPSGSAPDIIQRVTRYGSHPERCRDARRRARSAPTLPGMGTNSAALTLGPPQVPAGTCTGTEASASPFGARGECRSPPTWGTGPRLDTWARAGRHRYRDTRPALTSGVHTRRCQCRAAPKSALAHVTRPNAPAPVCEAVVSQKVGIDHSFDVSTGMRAAKASVGAGPHSFLGGSARPDLRFGRSHTWGRSSPSGVVQWKIPARFSVGKSAIS